jgi:hypothetical protein
LCCGLEHFNDEHVAFVADWTGSQRLAGQLLVAITIILLFSAMRLGRWALQELAA